MSERFSLLIGPFSIDGGDELEVGHGREGTWKIVDAVLNPHTTLAAHADNHQTVTLKKGAAGTAIAMMTSDSDDATYGAAYTKGTPRQFVFTGTGTNLEFTKSNVLEVVVAEGGTTAALEASITVTFEKTGSAAGADR